MDKQEYQVGENNPSKETQFKSGCSGKPKAKKSLSIKEILLKEMKKKTIIKENNKIRTMTKIEAIIANLLNQAIEGNIKHLQLFLKLLEITKAMPSEGLDEMSLEKAMKALYGQVI